MLQNNRCQRINTFVFSSAVATAAKAWQKFKGPEQEIDSQQAADHSEQQHVCSSAVASRAPATVHTSSGVCQPAPSDALRNAAAGGGADNAGSVHAAVQSLRASPSHTAGLQLTDSSRSSVVGGQASHRVEFEQSGADAAAGDAAVAQQAGEGLEAEQQVSAADLRARVAARMRR